MRLLLDLFNVIKCDGDTADDGRAVKDSLVSDTFLVEIMVCNISVELLISEICGLTVCIGDLEYSFGVLLAIFAVPVTEFKSED